MWGIAQKTKLLMLLWTAAWFMSDIVTEEDYRKAGVSHPVTEANAAMRDPSFQSATTEYARSSGVWETNAVILLE